MTLEVMINISNFNKNSAFGIVLYLIEKKTQMNLRGAEFWSADLQLSNC